MLYFGCTALKFHQQDLSFLMAKACLLAVNHFPFLAISSCTPLFPRPFSSLENQMRVLKGNVFFLLH